MSLCQSVRPKVGGGAPCVPDEARINLIYLRVSTHSSKKVLSISHLGVKSLIRNANGAESRVSAAVDKLEKAALAGCCCRHLYASLVAPRPQGVNRSARMTERGAPVRVEASITQLFPRAGILRGTAPFSAPRQSFRESFVVA